MFVLVLVGTKAQFIKTAPVLLEMDRRGVVYRLVYTGQHSETFDLLESAFGTRAADDVLVPDFEADTKASFVRWIWRFWSQVVKRLRNGSWRDASVGLVHGDTASTLLGALAIRLAGARVGHIEAGLRSPRLFDPFPEEIIRRLVSQMANLHFAPDKNSADNLRNVRGQVVNTQGNTLRDALSAALNAMQERPTEGGSGGYAVVSMHRNENLSNQVNFDLLMEAVVDAANVLPVKFVLHPATRTRIVANGWKTRLESIASLELVERMNYPNFIRLLLDSNFLMTDGGSNQEEAAMLGLPTLLLRRVTERHDGLGDRVVLSSLDRTLIDRFVRQYEGKRWTVRAIVESPSPSVRIVDSVMVECDGTRRV